MSISETACLESGLQHNGSVRFRAYALVVVAAILLAGCSTPGNRNLAQGPMWQDIQTVVPADPIFPIAGPVDTNLPPAARLQTVPHPVPPPAEGWVPLQRWSRANNLGSVVRLGAASSSGYELRTTNGSLVVHTGSQQAEWDGMELRLGFAPQLIDGQPYLHSLDLNKTVHPLVLSGSGLSLNQNSVIVIDPGHGGENAGTKCVLGNHYEKEFTLDWGLRLQAVLLANGCRAFLTRSNDYDLALSNRVNFATQRKADLFISLHFNSAAPNENEAGLETYCLTPSGMPSNLTRGYTDEIRQTFPNNAFDTENLWLASRIHRAVLQVNGHHDRGIRRARFPGVLRGQQRAAILVEGGYLSNPQEARLISDPAYRQKLAETIAKALLPSNAAPVAIDSQASHPLAKPAAALVVLPDEPSIKTSPSELSDERGR
jgi:N-acetylmuramoyl-L-alanine amidase